MTKYIRRLVAGLGNPGDAYARTRHNIGFMVLDEVADRFSVSITKKRHEALIGQGKIEGIDTVLVKPMAFMNRSGFPVYDISRKFGICIKDILVIHDDMDLDFGRIKIKEKGGDGGHKGIRSLIEAFGDDNFVRLRMGIGRPSPGTDVTDYVLGKFIEDEANLRNSFISRGREAVVTLLCKGTKEGMNIFNRKPLILSSQTEVNR